jgi:hypothetical protein
MKRLIITLTLLGLATFVCVPGGAAASKNGGGAAFRPRPPHTGGGSSTYRPNSSSYRPPTLPSHTYHGPRPQFVTPSYDEPATAHLKGPMSRAHSRAAVPGPTPSLYNGPARAGSGSAGTTLTLKPSNSNNGSASLISRTGSAGATVPLNMRPNQTLGGASGGKKPPVAATNLTGSRQNAMNSLNKMAKSGTLRLTGNDKSLTLKQTADLANFLNSPQSSFLTQTERAILTKELSGQPLTAAETAIALNAIGKNGMSQVAAAAVAQGVIDNLGKTNPGVLGNNSPTGGVLGALAQVLQSLPSLGGAGGIPASGGGDPGFGSGPSLADTGMGNVGVVDAPVGQESSYSSSDAGATQPVMPAGAGDEGTSAGVQAVRQFRRYLQVKNDSAAKLTVFVQYSAHLSDNSFKWFPTPPGGDEAVGFTLAPGATVDVGHDGWRVKANRVRIWAVSEDGTEVTDYRDQDLWLVAEQNGDRTYDAPEIGVFTFTFGG